MSSSTSMLGRYGGMPSSELYRKFEKTNIYEDQDQINTYHRNILKDRGPDSVTLSSDLPRGGYGRGGYFSRGMINLRNYGRLSPLEAEHGEQFFELTERDPRGTSTEPNMQLLNAQSYARGRYRFFTSDADYSVPESGRNESQVNRDKKAGFYATKKRMKIFSTSKNNFQHSGGILPKKFGTNRLGAKISRGIIPNLSALPSYERRGKVTTVSNRHPIGYRNTSDHTFKVANGNMNKPAMMAHNPNTAYRFTDGKPKITVMADMIVTNGLAPRMRDIGEDRKTAFDLNFLDSDVYRTSSVQRLPTTKQKTWFEGSVRKTLPNGKINSFLEYSEVIPNTRKFWGGYVGGVDPRVEIKYNKGNSTTMQSHNQYKVPTVNRGMMNQAQTDVEQNVYSGNTLNNNHAYSQIPSYSKYARQHGSGGVIGAVNKISYAACNSLNILITGVNKGTSIFGIHIPKLNVNHTTTRNHMFKQPNINNYDTENYKSSSSSAASSHITGKGHVRNVNQGQRFNLISSTLFGNGKHTNSRGNRSVYNKNSREKSDRESKQSVAKENNTRNLSAAGFGLKNLALVL